MFLKRNTIHLGDALHLIDEVDDDSIDLIICDGPYGVTAHGWDRIANIQEYNLDLIRRFSDKLKYGGALYLFGKPNCIDFIDYRPYLNLKSKIVWYQQQPAGTGQNQLYQ